MTLHRTLTLVAMTMVLAPAAAQEVQWRRDFNEARREAKETGRPIFIDFGSDNCVWCRRLDATTLRHPAVVSLLNDGFIPLRVNATREPYLAEVLRIAAFPTIVLAGTDGRILAMLEGYQEVPKLMGELRRVAAATVAPTSDASASRDFEAASAAIAAADYATALGLLRRIAADPTDGPTQGKARQLLRELELQADERVTRARQMADRGQAAEAGTLLREVVQKYPATRAALDAADLLTARPAGGERVVAAQQLLARAHEDYRAGQFLPCLERCDQLAAQYPDLPQAEEARRLAAQVKDNPEWLRRACESLGDRLGDLYLALAESYLRKGQPQQAVACLELVAQRFAGTRHAEVAQARLAQVQGQPTLLEPRPLRPTGP